MTKESQLLVSVNRGAWRTAFISLIIALLIFIAAALLPASSPQQNIALLATAGLGLLFLVAGFLYFITELKQPTRSIEQVKANRISSPPPGWRGLGLTGFIRLLGMGLLAAHFFYWNPLAAAPHLTFQEIADPTLSIKKAIIWNRNRYLSNVARNFLACLLAART